MYVEGFIWGDFLSSLGIRITELLDKHKLTQAQLGEIINVSESTISLYKHGKRQPDYETLFHIADYFEVSTDYLLGRVDISTFVKQTKNDEELSLIIKDLPEDALKLLKEFEAFIIQKYRK